MPLNAHMTTYSRYFVLVLVLVMLPISSVGAQQDPPPGQSKIYLPIVSTLPAPPNPFGFDVRAYSNAETMQFVQMARPKWSRAGDVLWSEVEPVRGEYRWEALAQLEANVQRLREANIEPVVVVQQSPEWAQSISGRRCSPMKPEHVADFARFMNALVTRYSSGPLAVKYYEIWNEPDHSPENVADIQGAGCWANPSLPFYGGQAYGEMLKQVYPAVKSANPEATILAGALAYFWHAQDVSMTFLRGILESGAGSSFDILTFHAYGEWAATDLLVSKTLRIRELLKQYGMPNKPLAATEIAATCTSNDPKSCQPSLETWKDYTQGSYAARIYAEAIALDLVGAFWYTLVSDNPGFAYSHLIDYENGQLVPRRSFFAFVNSAQLLEGARYVGPPLKELTPDQKDKVQTLQFQKPNGNRLHVLWVPDVEHWAVQHNLPVYPGARAICTIHLEGLPDDPDPLRRLQRYDCSDKNRDGNIPVAVLGLPIYIEVLR